MPDRDHTFERIGALSGLAFFVLVVLSGFIYPQQPRVDAAPAKTLAWVHDHHVVLQAGMIFDFFAAGALVSWFAGYLVPCAAPGSKARPRRLRPSSSPSAIGVSITTAIPPSAPPRCCWRSWMRKRGGLSDLSLVRVLGDLNTIFFSATSVMTAVFLPARLGHAARRAWPAAGSAGWALLVAAFNCIRRAGSVSRSAATTATRGSSSAGAPTSASSSSCSSPASRCCAGPAPRPPRRRTAPEPRPPRPSPPSCILRHPSPNRRSRGPFAHMARAARSGPLAPNRRGHDLPPDPTPEWGLRQ